MNLCSPRVLAAGLVLLLAGLARANPVQVDIPYKEFTLPNGLRVIVHEDRKAPIVAVNVWYHVGAKNEPAGKTGFAHLFEHLMFQGSENWDGEYFAPFELVGATDMNGTTNADRTNYFQNVPTTALDMALWMESDRMGHFLGAIDQDLLDEQRGVVQNEKRQGENRPYGLMWQRLFEHSYPATHPYHHTTIGSMEDLEAASTEDVKRWFRTWYGPNNAVLVLAGDIDVETARAKVTRYFGHIPAGPTMAQPETMIAKRSESTRATMEDRVPQVRIVRAWNVPQFGHEDTERLQLLAQVLGGSKASRLDKRLVHQDKVADRVATFVFGQEIGGMFIVFADVKEGVDPTTVEKLFDEEVQRLIADGPTQKELDQARTVLEAGFVRGVERIGGFGGKADVLAECAVYLDDPGCYRDGLKAITEAGVADLRAVAQRWLASGGHTLLVVPGEKSAAEIAHEESAKKIESAASASADEGTDEPLPAADPKFRTVKSGVDRSQGPPMPEQYPELRFPELQRGRLSNGVPLVLAERHEIPVVQMSLEFGGGYAADTGRRLGTASFTMNMLDEGAGEYGALEFADRMESLGAQIGAGASLDGGNASVSALKERLDASVALFADVVRRPRFEDKEIERVRQSWIAGIKQEKAQPQGLAFRLLPPLMYGDGHAYAIPFSGTGTEASIAALTREDLVGFHRDYVRPDNATLIVVGDTTMGEIVPVLEKHFADWKAPDSPQPEIQVGKVELPGEQRVFLVDQPGAIQANILVGQVVPSSMDPKALEFELANSVLGGEFSSRLNMNLRENKHWAYGAYSFVSGAKGQRPWIGFAPVQIDKTVESLAELQREIGEYASGKVPASDAEIDKIQATEVRGLPGQYETAGAVLGAIGGIIRYQRPDDYVVQRQRRIEAMDDAAVRAAARVLQPKALTWVVVGDLSKIEQPVREAMAGKATVKVIDASGAEVTPAPVDAAAPERGEGGSD
ncbi:MAG TPA: pitrilysin family protein [Xanthomonadaceae bacterium]|nr:pitrilysin family protein [Xanthomonadaceae bacterium]